MRHGKHGQREPIRLYHGQILDGRNRYKACETLGIAPQCLDLPEDLNPYDYAWSLNAARRDLEPGVKALIGLRLRKASADWEAERWQAKEAANRKRSEAMAGNRNASKDPDKNSLVSPDTALFPEKSTTRERNRVALMTGVSSATAGRALLVEEKRPDLADQVLGGKLDFATAVREMKRDEIRQRLEEVAAREVEAPTGLFDVIVIDPPWPME